MKEVEILSYKEGRVRMKANRAFHNQIVKLLEGKFKGVVVQSNMNTKSITINGLKSLEEVDYPISFWIHWLLGLPYKEICLYLPML